MYFELLENYNENALERTLFDYRRIDSERLRVIYYIKHHYIIFIWNNKRLMVTNISTRLSNVKSACLRFALHFAVKLAHLSNL